jgi:enoyl-CoA hydratase/carnithine racemase
MADLLYEVRDKVAYITFNRPEKKNAINKDMAAAFYDALEDVRKNPDVWVCLITGKGKDFSTGHDLTWMSPDIGSGRSAENIFEHLMTIWKPTLSAINGYCLAQGVGFALSCDIRMAADNAQLGWPHAKLNIPSTSGTCILSRMIPFNIAMEYLYTGEFMSAQEALRLNLVNRVVPADKLLEEADRFIHTKILPNAPLAMRAMKELAVRGRDMTFPDQVRFAGLFRNKMESSKDMKEGIAAFLEKRTPKFEGA